MPITRLARRFTAVAAACACATGLAACGGGGADQGSDKSAATLPTPTPTVDAAASLPAVVPAEVDALPVDTRIRSKLSVAGGPDWLTAAAGSMWVKTDEGYVLRYDPKTDKQIAKIRVADELCQGIGSDENTVWACSDSGVVRIDLATNKVAAQVVVDKFNDQGQIPVAFGQTWVLTGDGSSLVGIVDDKVRPPTELGTRCIDLVATRTALWAACPIDGQAVRINPATGEVTARIKGLEEARTIGAGDAVWVGYAGGLAKIDESAAKVTGVADASTGPFGGLLVTPDAVWVRAQGRFLRKVDPASLKVVEQLDAPEDSGGAVKLLDGSLWATAYDHNVIYRLDLS